MRGLRSTLVLLVVALGLGGYIFFFERHRPAGLRRRSRTSSSSTSRRTTSPSCVVDAGRGQAVTELRRTEGAWVVVAPVQAAADDSATSSIASTLASLEVQRVVEEGPVDLEPFGLAEPALDIGFTLADAEAPRRLLIGEQTPTGGRPLRQARRQRSRVPHCRLSRTARSTRRRSTCGTRPCSISSAAIWTGSRSRPATASSGSPRTATTG